MDKVTFTSERSDGSKTIIEFDADSDLSGYMEAFRRFLWAVEFDHNTVDKYLGEE